jgi:peptidoglycan hydrolase CwlO-like protein
MAEPQDAVMPVLQKIQKDTSDFRKDMSDFRKSVEAKINDVVVNLLELKEDVSTMNRHMSHHMGVTMQHRSDFEDLRAEVADLKTRMAALEQRS